MRAIKFIVLAIFLTCTSCKRNVVKVDEHFNAEWEATDPNLDIYLSISAGGRARYENYTANKSEWYSGQAKVNKKKKEFYIDKKMFSIEAFPYQTNDSTGTPVWRMKIGGVEYERVY